MLILDEKTIKELNDFIQELPVKYGLPLLNFINQKIKDQQLKEKETIVEENK